VLVCGNKTSKRKIERVNKKSKVISNKFSYIYFDNYDEIEFIPFILSE
jgi:hypothetical protein